ncbi:MAG: GNAT family N-acetyltransferase [Candidatus Neomarinimicrobiota bacterium]
MKIDVRKVNTTIEKDQALALRREVFIIEQQVPEAIEIDEFEDSARHVLALVDDRPAGTARWRSTAEGIKLERFAVKKEFRFQGVGSALVNYLLEQMPDENLFLLHAQVSVMPFYAKFGFRPVGEIFHEASIPHRKMIFNRMVK